MHYTGSNVAGGMIEQLTEFLKIRGKLWVITEGQDRAGNGRHLWGQGKPLEKESKHNWLNQ